MQVRKLGEGFDHPWLSVAAVFSIFSNLGPFMQFVGRIMRVLPDVDPFNDGVVVFHVGGNVTGVWNDFQEFAGADQEFFAHLIDETVVEPVPTGEPRPDTRGGTPIPVITGQDGVELENLTLISVSADPDVAHALAVLKDKGVTDGAQFDQLQRIHPTRQQVRRAKRHLLDELVKTEVGKFLARHGLRHGGRDLDRTRDNFRTVKAAIDNRIKSIVPSGARTRDQYTAEDCDEMIARLPEIVAYVQETLNHG